MTPLAPKVSVIGGGAVGATLAMRVLESGLADVVLLDIADRMAAGKSLDLLDAAPIVGHERLITGTGDYSAITSSDIVVITAGLARTPGMSREDLIAKNTTIVRAVAGQVKSHAPHAIVIVVTNPLDSMAFVAYRETGFPKERVMGMAGVLDGARFIQLIAAELDVPRASVATYVLGSHGDTMVPVISRTTVNGQPLADLLSGEKIAAIVKRTCDRGAEIVKLLGTGSAYYSPSAAVFAMVEAILGDTKKEFSVSAFLEGEYGVRDLYIGVPCRLGRGGIEEIIELPLSVDERAAFQASARAIKGSIKAL